MIYVLLYIYMYAAAKSLQSCPTLCDLIDVSPPGSPIPGILQATTVEWVVISFSNVWKWKVKVKSLSRVQLLATPWTAAHQAPPSMGFSRQSTGVGCHCLLRTSPFRTTFQPYILWEVECRNTCQIFALITYSLPVANPLRNMAQLLSYPRTWSYQNFLLLRDGLSSGRRAGKGQFSFQFQRKAVPNNVKAMLKNAQTTAQLHSSHTPAK